MSEWSKTPPATDGWYWWKRTVCSKEEPVCVHFDTGALTDELMVRWRIGVQPLSTLGGEWGSRIPTVHDLLVSALERAEGLTEIDRLASELSKARAELDEARSDWTTLEVPE
ncbi:MAG: hypothetical protein GY700_06470 [Propionibacteriaceae bacterium]|nr:hypothetical protein [Propionibacteriaceae bacterium]